MAKADDIDYGPNIDAKSKSKKKLKAFPDHYAGELNTKRIKAYKALHEQYNLEEGTVRDIFCKGADWYKEQLEK